MIGLKLLARIAGILCAFLLWCSQAAMAQQLVTIGGYVTDADSKEQLIGANIWIPELMQGGSANSYGYYAMPVKVGTDSLTLEVSYIGYNTEYYRFLPVADTTINVALTDATASLNAVVIQENPNRARIESTQMGVQQLTANNIKSIPTLFGESDILKVVQLTAGVQPGQEGTNGFFVRGGAADQNLILLDEAVVYNPDHFGGLFSTFNSDIIKNANIYKSDFPAAYGGRLSSVLDIQMREGNLSKYEVQGGIGLISSRIAVEGPIVKDKASFVLAGRRTYLDIFTPIINNQLSDDLKAPNYFFYDVNAKLNYIIGNNDRLYLSGYFGKDRAEIDFGSDLNSDYTVKWGNTAATLRWNHIFGQRMFSNTSLTYSRFNFGDRFNFNDFYRFRSSSEAINYTLKYDLDIFADSKHTIKTGLLASYHNIRPVSFYAGVTENDTGSETVAVSEKQAFTGQEFAAYALDNFAITHQLSLKYGLRISAFRTQDGNKLYVNAEPRIATNYQINEKTALKASYARMAQSLNQVRYSDLSFIDPWFPANDFIEPQLSDQVSVGITRLFFNDKISLTNEYYYKWLHNQMEYGNAQDFLFLDENYHQRLVFGKGTSYGTEIQLEKPMGKTTGWLSYTLSFTDRTFPDLNNGESFPFTYDRRHVINLVVQHDLGKNWTINGNFTYRTGIAMDLAIGRYFVYGLNFTDPQFIPVYLSRNSFRMAPYHRMDIGLSKKMPPKPHFQSEWVLSIYNIYNRRNPFFIYYDSETNDNGDITRFTAKQASLFPIIPTISWNFKFF